MLKEKGFTLVELMIALFMSAIIYAGIVIIFNENKAQMEHATNRAEAVSALNHAISEISKVVRSGVSDPWTIGGTTPAANSPLPTSDFYVDVYDPARNPLSPYLVQRYIDFNTVNNTLGIRMSANTGRRKLAENVTFFKIFDDSVTPRAGFIDIPPPLPDATRILPDGSQVVVHGYTILIQISIDILNRKSQENMSVDGSPSPAGTQSVWRCLQIYPENPYIF